MFFIASSGLVEASLKYTLQILLIFCTPSSLLGLDALTMMLHISLIVSDEQGWYRLYYCSLVIFVYTPVYTLYAEYSRLQNPAARIMHHGSQFKTSSLLST